MGAALCYNSALTLVNSELVLHSSASSTTSVQFFIFGIIPGSGFYFVEIVEEILPLVLFFELSSRDKISFLKTVEILLT